ncbi:uncharacterized protein LOC100169288 isoform X1 [Acyrthosiphon pisum]|uniref:Cytochrome b561 domain-containing protein n=1 Tax=Acyrthosiphon pisum TaxID=7029 RepID=A0A8R2NMG0_ACYPI|nr:uncharacterized protein LOC100169288 isoform X1 [Acyrthosiphon pisum]
MCIPQENKYPNKTLLQITSSNYTLFYRIFQFIGLLLICSVYYWIINYRGGFSLTKAKLIPNWHPIFMTIVLIYLFANAILHYRSFRDTKRNLKYQHAIFFGCIIIILTIAGIATLGSKRFRPLFTNPAIPNLYSLHSWLGIITMAMLLLQFASGFWIYLYPTVAAQYREIMMPYHVFFGVSSFVLAIASGGLGFCEKMIFSLYREYEQFPGEGIIGNCIGLLCIFYGVLVVYMVTKPEFKRCPAPEYQPLI